MSTERRRAREARLAEAERRRASAERAAAVSQRRERRRRRWSRRAAGWSRARRRRYGRRSLPEKAAIAAGWLFAQFVCWQLVDDPSLRVGFALVTLLALPALVVLATDRRNAPS